MALPQFVYECNDDEDGLIGFWTWTPGPRNLLDPTNVLSDALAAAHKFGDNKDDHVKKLESLNLLVCWAVGSKFLSMEGDCISLVDLTGTRTEIPKPGDGSTFHGLEGYKVHPDGNISLFFFKRPQQVAIYSTRTNSWRFVRSRFDGVGDGVLQEELEIDAVWLNRWDMRTVDLYNIEADQWWKVDLRECGIPASVTSAEVERYAGWEILVVGRDVVENDEPRHCVAWRVDVVRKTSTELFRLRVPWPLFGAQISEGWIIGCFNRDCEVAYHVATGSFYSAMNCFHKGPGGERMLLRGVMYC